MCVQNVPFKTKEREWMEKEYMKFKTREKDRKWALDELIRFADDNGLSVGFVPLCADSRPLTVCCPMCSLVMLDNGTEYFCPDCGIRG